MAGPQLHPATACEAKDAHVFARDCWQPNAKAPETCSICCGLLLQVAAAGQQHIFTNQQSLGHAYLAGVATNTACMHTISTEPK